MTKVLRIATILFFVAVSVYAEDEVCKKDVSICPKTFMDNSCLTCHEIPNFEIEYNYPNDNIRIQENDNHEKFGYFVLKSISDNEVKEAFDFLNKLDIKYLVLEIHSSGGSMMRALRIVSMIKYWESRGFIVETRCHGLAASAGFLILASGTKGYRYAAPTSLQMWHEVQAFKMFDLSDPSKKADEADILRFFQDNGNSWLSQVSKMTKKEIDDKVHKQEWWMNGLEAFKFGFVDKLL